MSLNMGREEVENLDRRCGVKSKWLTGKKRWPLAALVVVLVAGLTVGIRAPVPVEAASGQILAKPCSGKITQEFSGSHSGIDIATPSGTSVYAPASGVVKEIRTGSYRRDPGSGGAGNYIVIQHKPGDSNQFRKCCPMEEWTFYFHLEKVCVKSGQKVNQGQLIGTVGNTGNTVGSTGYHLHFEIRENGRYGKAGNPREYIRFGDGKDIW